MSKRDGIDPEIIWPCVPPYLFRTTLLPVLGGVFSRPSPSAPAPAHSTKAPSPSGGPTASASSPPFLSRTQTPPDPAGWRPLGQIPPRLQRRGGRQSPRSLSRSAALRSRAAASLKTVRSCGLRSPLSIWRMPTWDIPAISDSRFRDSPSSSRRSLRRVTTWATSASAISSFTPQFVARSRADSCCNRSYNR